MSNHNLRSSEDLSSQRDQSRMPKKIEKRVAHLEAEVALLKSQVGNDLSSKPWWEKITGTFSDNSAYDEAMEMGREYRESLRPIEPESSDG